MKPSSPTPQCNLPHDLLMEIFHKLPIKSLCRFKSTSKSIHDSIKHPLFITKRRPKTLIKWQTVFDTNLDLYTIYQSGVATKPKKFEFEGCLFHSKVINGLICFQDCENRLCLYNPTTEKLISLPEWEHNFELAYVAKLNQYKVFGWEDCGFQVLTLGKGSTWKPVVNNLGITYLPDYPQAVNASEFLYWFDKYQERIISFNLVTERFAFVGLPKQIDLNEYEYSIFEFENELCFVEKPDPRTARCNLDIVNCWMLKDGVNNVWALMMSDVVMPVEGTELGCFYSVGDRDACSVVCGNNGEVMVLAADSTNAWIFAWDVVSGNLRRIRVGDEQCCINMALVRKHVDNDIDLKQFRPRRAKRKAYQGSRMM